MLYSQKIHAIFFVFANVARFAVDSFRRIARGRAGRGESGGPRTAHDRVRVRARFTKTRRSCRVYTGNSKMAAVNL